MEIELTVENAQNDRLDSYVSKQNQNLSRSRLKNGIAKILLNGKNAKLSSKVKDGDVIFVEWADPVPTTIKAENIPLKILYEDENVCVVNKKQGMVTHPASGNWSGTLVNALLFHWNRENIENTDENCAHSEKNLRPGIVHRLDKDTSGLIICAKNIDSEIYLQKQFKEHRVQKKYIAIVKGRPPQKKGSVKVNLIRDTKNRKKFTWTQDSSKGKFSHTLYKCIASYGNYSLMVLTLKTGRTHQIRVHMKYLGCPILGDPIYGSKDKIFPDATLMLHSKFLKIRLPGSSEFSEFYSETPKRFKKIMSYLHKNYDKT